MRNSNTDDYDFSTLAVEAQRFMLRKEREQIKEPLQKFRGNAVQRANQVERAELHVVNESKRKAEEEWKNLFG